MRAQTENTLVWYSPAELVTSVRSGGIRYPSPRHVTASDVAQTLDGLVRGYPQPRVLLWRDPAAVDNALWLLVGGSFISALLVASGGYEEVQIGDEPILLDTDTGEVVGWNQRPDGRHVLLEVTRLLSVEDHDTFLAAERMDASRADRARLLVDAMGISQVPAQVTAMPRHELPRFLRYLPFGDGVSIDEIDGPPGPEVGPSPSWFTSRNDQAERVFAAQSDILRGLPDEAVWSVLLAAEGRDPTMRYQPEAPTGLPDEGRNAVRAVWTADAVLRGVAGFGRGRLLPAPASVAAVARFLRVFGTVDEPTRPLLRRWLWRQALTEGEMDMTPSAFAAIDGDQLDSLVRLLQHTPAPSLRPPGRIELDQSSRYGRLVLLAMASLHPRDLGTGVLVDVEDVAPKPIFPALPAEPANLVLTDYVWRAGHRDLAAAIVHAEPSVRASHGIDDEAARLLDVRDEEGFLARRARRLDEAVVAYWTSRTEPGAATRQPVAALFGDQPDG